MMVADTSAVIAVLEDELEGPIFSYALASVRGLPLLYKGEDFARTDIATVM